jgi:CDP-paratose 2-epimerase
VKVFITGGAGFIGVNVAAHHLERGDDVVVYDDLSRAGTAANIDWLKRDEPAGLSFVRGDIRDFESLRRALPMDVARVYHLAAQVAVTTSVVEPRTDFEVNALGTFNVLEAVRLTAPEAVVLYASTNKVYGGMENIAVVEENTRYRYDDHPHGISEEEPLDFHSPYGCSKGAGDQYVRDYARIFGLRTVVMRQSCIYGTRQMGAEDQGWLAYFCIAAQTNRPITVYGDGKQVRDVLWIDDLIEAYDAAADRVDALRGEIYNIGGGPEHTLAIWSEFGPMLEDLAGNRIDVAYAPWRPGDQPVYVSDIRKAARELGWRPRVSADRGIERMWRWVASNRELFTGPLVQTTS